MPAFASEPLRKDYVVVRGSSFYRQFRLRDRATGSPIDLTSAAVDMHVRLTADASDPPHADLSAYATITDAANGEITIDAPGTALDLAPFDGVHDLRLTRAGPVVDYLVQGTFRVIQAVTRT